MYAQNGVIHYTKHKDPEPPEEKKPKKEYLTKKKLQANIANADVQIEDLENQFKAVSRGWTYNEVVKDFGSLDGLTDGDDLAKLKDLHSQAEVIEAQKAAVQQQFDEVDTVDSSYHDIQQQLKKIEQENLKVQLV